MYPLVTTRVSTEPKDQFRETGIRDYECDICGHRQKELKQNRIVNVKNKVRVNAKKSKRLRPKTKTNSKTKSKPKRKRA